MPDFTFNVIKNVNEAFSIIVPGMDRNLVTNHSFETGVTGWTVQTNATLTRTNADSVFGSYCADYAKTGTSALIYENHTLAGSTVGLTFTWSGYFKAKAGGDVGKQITLWIEESGGTESNQHDHAYHTLTADWVRVSISYTILQSDRTALTTAFYLGTNGNAYVDGLQLETGLILTPYIEENDFNITKNVNETFDINISDDFVIAPNIVIRLDVDEIILGTTGYASFSTSPASSGNDILGAISIYVYPPSTSNIPSIPSDEELVVYQITGTGIWGIASGEYIDTL